MMIKHETYKPTWRTQSIKAGRYYLMTHITEGVDQQMPVYVKSKDRLEKDGWMRNRDEDVVVFLFLNDIGELVETNKMSVSDLRYNYHKPVEITKEVAMIMGMDISQCEISLD